jgi:short-subunit dehydrogenase
MKKTNNFLITGATSGIGLATTFALAKVANTIIMVGRDTDKLKMVSDQLKSCHPDIDVLTLDIDLSDSKKVNCHSTFGMLEYLPKENYPNVFIHSAGEFQHINKYEEITDELQKKVYQVNLFSFSTITRLLLPKMKEGKFGRIIAVSSRSGLLPYSYRSSYAGSKAALNMEVMSLNKELKRSGADVRAHVLCPGPVHGSRLDMIIKERSSYFKTNLVITEKAYKKDAIKVETITQKINDLCDPSHKEKRSLIRFN